MPQATLIQLASDNITDGNLGSIYENSVFLKDFRSGILQKTKGCVLMEDPIWLKEFSDKHNAVNTSNRSGMLSDLENAPVVCSHGSCTHVPERNWIYKVAKKTAFFGMGSYG
jgi:hypothetical protein